MDAADKLLAIEEIKQLKSRYFRCMDTKDWEGLGRIFTHDAVFDARSSLTLDETAGDPSFVWHGGQAIADQVRSVVTPLQTVHHGHGHEIEITSPTEARGVIAMEDQIWVIETGAVVLHGCGHYHETYRREPDGWRILSSKLTRLYIQVGG